MWDFEETIYRHRPTDAGYYFLVRYGRNHEIIRLPAEGAWRAREPMEEPIAPGGAWFVQYSKDAHGRERVHPVGKVGPLRVVLRWPENNGATADPDATSEEAGDGTEDSAPASQAGGDSMLASHPLSPLPLPPASPASQQVGAWTTPRDLRRVWPWCSVHSQWTSSGLL